MLKRIAAAAAAVVMIMSLTSCSFMSGSISDMLKAPRTNGERYDIQRALYKYAGNSITLCYPQNGENRTAFIQSDLDRDGVNEAVAFYTLDSADGVVEVHVNLIDLVDGEWVSVSDIATGASAIDKVEISSLQKNGAPVLMVGAELFSTTGNQLNLYTYIDGKLSVRMQEGYTEFMLCDLLGAGYDQIMILNLRASERTANAALYSVGAETTELIGTAPLDGNISAFSSVKLGTLSDGRPAVFVDSLKSTSSMVTDTVYLNSGTLVNPFFDSTLLETQSTLRNTTAVCRDINGDGFTEIPFTEVMPGYETRSYGERMYMTVWRGFDGAKFSTVTAGDYNYTDGYYLAFDPSWQGSVTLIYDASNAMRSYRVWDPVMQSTADEILRIRVYTAEEFDSFDSSGLTVLAREKGKVYAARIVADKGAYAVTESKLREAFGLL